MPAPADVERYRELPDETEAAEKAYEAHVEAAEPDFLSWQQTQGPGDVPRVDEDGLEMRLFWAIVAVGTAVVVLDHVTAAGLADVPTGDGHEVFRASICE